MGRVKKKMKISITILALFVIGYSTAATLGLPVKTSYCMGRLASKTGCKSCFNWGSGTIGARELLTEKCAAKVSNVVAGCLMYNGTIAKASK